MKQAWRSTGFWQDLLTDENGYSFHRYQMLVWTLVVTGIFWGSVTSHLCMPNLEPALLALMGISSGVYLGFKLPEQQPAAARA